MAWKRAGSKPNVESPLGGANERSVALSEACGVDSVPPVRTRESRARSIRAKATEGVKNLDSSPEELPGVEGSERLEGDDGNWRGPPQPNGLRCPGRLAGIDQITLNQVEEYGVTHPRAALRRRGWPPRPHGRLR